jgi:hypothetical protein
VVELECSGLGEILRIRRFAEKSRDEWIASQPHIRVIGIKTASAVHRPDTQFEKIPAPAYEIVVEYDGPPRIGVEGEASLLADQRREVRLLSHVVWA